MTAFLDHGEGAAWTPLERACVALLRAKCDREVPSETVAQLTELCYALLPAVPPDWVLNDECLGYFPVGSRSATNRMLSLWIELAPELHLVTTWRGVHRAITLLTPDHQVTALAWLAEHYEDMWSSHRVDNDNDEVPF